MKLFPNTRRPYRLLLLITLMLGVAGIALTLTGWALGGSIFTAKGYDDAFDSGFADVSKVEADISTGDVYIRPGEAYSVSASGVSGDHYSCTVEDGILKVSYDLKNAPSVLTAARNWQAPTFTVTVPAGADADISVDVGTIEAAGVDCKTLSMIVTAGGVKAVLPGTEADYRIRAGVGVGSLRTPHSVYDGFDHAYRSSPEAALRDLTCGVKLGYVRLYFKEDEPDDEVTEEAFAPEEIQTSEMVSSAIGYHFTLPTSLPADFSGLTYFVEKSGADTFAQAKWSVGDGKVIFRMAPHDVDIGDLEEGYGEGYYEYEMMAGATEIECIAGVDGIYAAFWADPEYEYAIISDRVLTEQEITAMAESLT